MANSSRFPGGLEKSILLATVLALAVSAQGASNPTVTAMSPAPGSSVAASPGSILVTLSSPINPATVSMATVQLVRAGADGVLGTGDDIAVLPASISVVNSNQIKLDFNGSALVSDKYKLTLLSSGGVPPTGGLVAYWPFNEGTGTTTADLSGNGNNGTLQGPAWATGIKGNALSFSGSTSFVSINKPNVPAPWTLDFLVKRGITSDIEAVVMRGASSTIKLEQKFYTQKVGLGGTSDRHFNYEAPIGVWARLTLTTTSTTTSLYVNGVFRETIATSNIPLPMTAIGDSQHALIGSIDEMRVYNRVLSDLEIQGISGSITDSGGNALDGEFSGTFPSGDGLVGGDFSAQFEVLPTTRWKLTIPIEGAFAIPSGTIYTQVSSAASISDAAATINSMEIVDVDNQPGGRDYNAFSMLHTSPVVDKDTNYSGQFGVIQIARNTSGYPDVMNFYAVYDFDSAYFSTSSPGEQTGISFSRKQFVFDSTKTLYARCWFQRGDGHPGPLITNLRILSEITCDHMPGAVMLGNSLNTINWRVSPANAAASQQLYRATSPSGPFTLIKDFADNTTSSYYDFSMISGTSYYFKVVAKTSDGTTGADSNVLPVTLPPSFNVTAMSPAPGSMQTSLAGGILITLNAVIDLSTVSTNSVQIKASGTDGIIDTADDIVVAPISLEVVNANQIKIILPTQSKSVEDYRVTLNGNSVPIKNTLGKIVDGEYPGTSGPFPTGDGTSGGDFTATFQVVLPATTLAVEMPNSIAYGTAAVALTAAVSSQNTIVNAGSVTFQLNNGVSNIGAPVTSATVANGIASANYSIPANTPKGIYSVLASYNGAGALLNSGDNSQQLAISAATLTVTANSYSRIYGSPNPGFDGSVTGIQYGDGITATYATNASVASNLGTYSIVPTLVDPTGKLANYTVVKTNGNLTVTSASLIVTTADARRAYGEANPLFKGTLTGIQNSDDISTTFSSAAAATSPIGFYPIIATLNDPANKLSNYTVSLSNGTLTVTKAALTVTPADASRPYGAPNPAFSGTITGIQNNDNITATYATSAGPSSTVGTYAISATLVDPDNRLGNYSVTFGVGTLSINKAAPALVWPVPARIVAGNPLTAVQLNAAAQDAFSAAPLAGTFEYAPGDGTLLTAGLGQVLSVTFTPADTTNYIAATAQTTIDVDPAIPPTITSALSASVAKDAAFSYTIAADGTAPIALNATGLPPGLSFVGSDITGAPSATGVFYITLTATNFGGSDSKALKLTVLGTGTNHSPLMTSPLTVSANPATTATPVTFLAQATDEDGDALDYVWDFGDGTSGLGASVSKTYAAPGVYIASLTVSDGQSSATQSLNLVVNDQLAIGTFSIQKVKLAFNFAKGAKDSLNISGQIPVAPGFVPDGKSVRVLIGLLNVQTTLTSKGRSADRTFTLIGKRGSNVAKFTFALKNQDLFAKLQGLGFIKTQRNPNVSMPVIVVLDGQSYLDQPAIRYTVKSSKAGPSSGKGKKSLSPLA